MEWKIQQFASFPFKFPMEIPWSDRALNNLLLRAGIKQLSSISEFRSKLKLREREKLREKKERKRN